MSISEAKRVEELESENAKLKRMYAELALEDVAIQDVLSRKLWRGSPSALRCIPRSTTIGSRVRACQAMSLSRSALYKATMDRAATDAPVIGAINAVLEKRPRWGFWKRFDRLRHDSHGWNHKRVWRVHCAMRLNLTRKVRRRLLTRARQPLLASTQLNRVWALDFIRDTLYDGRPFRTLNVIDEGNREALRIECGASIPSARVVRVMNQLLEVYGKPAAIRLDNGPELTADAFVDWAKEHDVKLLFIQPGKPNKNAFIERFNCRFGQEVLDAWLFNAVSEVQTAADKWLADYNEFRPHDALGSVPPAVFKPRVLNRKSLLLDCDLHWSIRTE